MKSRLLFVGLDAADADLIDEWCGAGVLPNLSRMKARGTSFRMRTTAEMFHVSAWPSIFTGTATDQHGLYHAYVTRPGHQGVVRPRPDQTPFPFFWKLLSDRGKRSVVIDAFLTCPLEDFNGTQIVDWGTWSWFWEPTMIPRSLEGEIRKKFGPYPSEDHSKVGITPVTDIAGFRSRLLSAVARKTEVVKWLMDSSDWDLFVAVFSESHPAGHYFWHLHDPSYLTHPGNGAGPLPHALRDVYVALDGAIGTLLDNVDRQTTVLVVSGDGMGPNYSGAHLLPPMLVKMGALAASGVGADGTDAPPARGKRDLLRTLRDLVPKPIGIAISRAFLSKQTRDQLALRWKTAGIAWPSTRAFVIENANEGYLRVNLKGREPEGCVDPGRDYDQLCGELCQAARSMVNPANGRPCANGVYKTRDLFNGPFHSHLPDVVVTWDPEARVTTEALTSQYGLIRAEAPSCGISPFYSGNHRPNAFAVAIGPGVPAGLTLPRQDVLDVAPTVLSRFGIEAPTHMTGRIVPELRGVPAAEGPESRSLI